MNQIGRYKILAEVGRGAMGIVYRAEDPAIGRTVAIKTIRLSDLADTEERAKLHDRLFREAQSAGILSHPGIVTIYDVGEEGDTAYIAMEFVDGPTLDRLTASDPPDSRLVLSILGQTAAALDYAHKRGIVHRDIKPSNIILHERTTAKITDFGVARVQSQQMTHAGSMVGTPNYMSPEQIQGQPVSGSSDQFSLAVIAYELLTGEKPFTGSSMPELVFKIVQEVPVPVHRLNQSLNWAVDTVMKRALSKNPAERYPTCSDFIFALENACRGSKSWKPVPRGAMTDLPTVGSTPPPATPQARATSAPGRRERAMIISPPQESVPTVLRIARVLALVVVGGAIASGVLITALQYFSEDADEPAAARQEFGSPPDKKSPPTAEVPRAPAPAPEDAKPPVPEQPKTEEEAASTPALPGEEPPRDQRSLAERPSASVRLVTNPPGAFIVVDSRSSLSCTSPCSLPLSRGRHALSATKEGYRRMLRILEVSNDEEIFLNLDRSSGTVVVRSEPRGASIYVNGQMRAEKTPAVLTLPAGSHSIEVVRDGSRATRQVVVPDSVITNVTVDLNDQQ